jgi:hypothetical protein
MFFCPVLHITTYNISNSTSDTVPKIFLIIQGRSRCNLLIQKIFFLNQLACIGSIPIRFRDFFVSMYSYYRRHYTYSDTCFLCSNSPFLLHCTQSTLLPFTLLLPILQTSLHSLKKIFITIFSFFPFLLSLL